MSCWVVPAIAAELWGVSVNHVLAKVRDGSVPSRQEYGFTVVDVAPDSYTYHRPRRPGEPPPPTYCAVRRDEELPATDDEIELVEAELMELSAASVEPVALFWTDSAAAAAVAEEDPELSPLDEEEDSTPLPPRDAMRAAVARQRRRPLAA